MKDKVEKAKAVNSVEKTKQGAKLVVKTAVKSGPEVIPGRP